MFTLLIYIVLIVSTNFAFEYTPYITLPNGEAWPPVSIVVGFIFVVRDYAQRQVGHHVLWGMLIGCIISWYMASPQIAVASASAFAISELSDWLIYTITKKPFHHRILISSLISVPIDTIVFLLIIKIFSPLTFIIMVFSKLFAAFIIFYFLHHKSCNLIRASEASSG